MVAEEVEAVAEATPAPNHPTTKGTRVDLPHSWKGITFGYDRNSANNFDEHCDIINNYLSSELKIGADMLQELQNLEEVVLVKPTIDPQHPQLLAHEKREANRKQSAKRDLKLMNEQLSHYSGKLAAVNTGTRDKDEIFQLQDTINGLETKKDNAELELSIDYQFELTGEEGSTHDKDLDAYMKPKTKLEADCVLAHHVYKGAMHKDLTEPSELRSEWEPIRDDIKHVVDLVLLMQDIIQGRKSDLTIHIQVKE